MNNYTSNYLKAVNRVIIPTFVFAVKYIIKIEPCAELPSPDSERGDRAAELCVRK